MTEKQEIIDKLREYEERYKSEKEGLLKKMNTLEDQLKNSS
jgi:hypothetical protein